MLKDKPAKTATTFLQGMTLIIFGVFLFLLLLEASMRLGGFLILSAQEYQNSIALKKKVSYRILCVGESTTAGQYPSFLEQTLNRRNPSMIFSVINKGIIGGTTTDIVNNLESNIHQYKPDLVVAMMGINDHGKHMLYKKTPCSKEFLFLKSFKAYNFFRLLWQHIAEKIKESGLGKERCNGCDVHKTDMPSLETKVSGKENGHFQAEGNLDNEVSETNSQDGERAVELGLRYRSQGDFNRAEKAFKKAIASNSKNDRAYCELGRLYRDIRGAPQAEAAFKKAIELNPKNVRAYFGLGLFFVYQRFDPAQAEKCFLEAIRLEPKGEDFFVELGALYRSQGRLGQAEEILKEGLNTNPGSAKLSGALRTLASDLPEIPDAEGQKSRGSRGEYYYQITRDNFFKLKEILDEHGIRFVFVQYPMRKVEPLKNIFEDHASDMIFVDNEHIFKEALKRGSYKEYFTDMFGGDFGHCTAKGNRLLAENVAEVIMKEIF